MNDARQGPTTPSPRNAPPMTDRERLAALLYGSTYRDLPKPFSRFEALEMADALLAEGVTLPEVKPGKAGPVTSDKAVSLLFGDGYPDTNPTYALQRRNLARRVDRAVPQIAEDHGLLTPEEVERRAREWCFDRRIEFVRADNLVAALLRREVPRG